MTGVFYIPFKGLADAFIKMRLPFESEEACKLNRDIFETIYFGAVNASVQVSGARIESWISLQQL